MIIRNLKALAVWALSLGACLFTGLQPQSLGAEVWHFLDPWHFHSLNGLELCQGEPKWLPQKTFVDPIRGEITDHLNSWCTVWQDQATGKWRMVYSAKWRPATLMVAESDDGLDWRPLPCPNIVPVGGKIASNHVFTLQGGSVGGVYIDPQAADGYSFKIFGHRSGRVVIEDAQENPAHRQHEEAVDAEPFEHLADEPVLLSKDGLHWEMRLGYEWSQPHWHPEPPVFGFWNEQEQRHFMTVRPGWGDRRVCIQNTSDFVDWSGPRPLLQPDLQDGLVEFYGMPVFRYGEAYVGLLWVFDCRTGNAPRGFNRSVGDLETHLTVSYDGRHFQRGFRKPLIRRNAPGEIGGGALETSCMVQTESELRFYSDATSGLHGARPNNQGQEKPTTGIIIHTLRKDGLTYLRPQGGWGSFVSKPLALFEPKLTVNILAPQGQAIFQLSDERGEPLPGFSFEDCEPVAEVDELQLSLRWRNQSLATVMNQPLRIEARLLNAQLFAVRGQFHFLDAEDSRRLKAGKKIDTRWFDF